MSVYEIETPAGELAELWRRFKHDHDPAAKEALIVAYAPLVKYVAGRVAIGLPASVDRDDLASYGVFGLVDAVEKFDLERTVKFETYATSRIRGAIIDGLRAADWVPRSVRQKAKEVEHTVAVLEARLGRPATDREIADELGLTADAYRQTLTDIASVSLGSLEDAWADNDDESSVRVGQLVADESALDPEREVGRRELVRLLSESIDRLPERERLVVSLYYYEELTLKEIGQVLDVSESRISQIHTKALTRLRGKLARVRESLVNG